MIRIYIVAAASEKQLHPTFKRIPAGGIDASVEIISIDKFDGMFPAQIFETVQGVVDKLKDQLDQERDSRREPEPEARG